MSESETKTAALEGRVAELESQLAVFVDRAKDDDEQIRSLAQRVNEYGARYDEAVAAVDQRVADALAQFGARLYEAFAKDVAKDAVTQVTSETIAESLSKKVLVTRPAQRHELADAVVVRPAQRHESN
jgi:predicted  nucleic acid-binding Zn-ribbon protein